MRKYLYILILALPCLGGTLYAQGQEEISSDAATSPFDLPPDAIMDEFDIQLSKGNHLRVQLSNLADLETLTPTAILQEFNTQIQHFADSLQDPLSIKRIDYLTDTAGRTLIRIQQHAPKGDNFLVSGEDVSALKIEQDTVNILRVTTGATSRGKTKEGKNYVRLTFYLNDYHELDTNQGALLDTAISRIYAAARKQSHWTPKNNHNLKLTGAYSLDEAQANQAIKIVNRYRHHDYLSPNLEGNLQNVYHYLSPSLSLGVKFVFPRKDLTRELRFNWEPMFLFAKNDQGMLQTYRNDWITAEYSLYKNSHSTKTLAFTGNFSFGYLIRNKGGFFEKNTFRLGLGGLKFDKITLEPVLYFHDLFKGVTPGIRLGVSF